MTTEEEIIDKFLLEISVDVEAELRKTMSRTSIDDCDSDLIHRNVIGVLADNKAKYIKFWKDHVVPKTMENIQNVLVLTTIDREQEGIYFDGLLMNPEHTSCNDSYNRDEYIANLAKEKNVSIKSIRVLPLYVTDNYRCKMLGFQPKLSGWAFEY